MKNPHSNILKDVDISSENPLNNITSFKIKNLAVEENDPLLEPPSLDMFDSHLYKHIQDEIDEISNEDQTVITSRPLSINKSNSKNNSVSPSKNISDNSHSKRFQNDDKDKFYTYSQINPNLESLINQVRKVLPSDSYSKTYETFSKKQTSFNGPGEYGLLSSISRKYPQEKLNEKSSVINYSQLRTKSAGNASSKNPRDFKSNNSMLPNPCCLNLYEKVRHIRGIYALQKPIKHKIFLKKLHAFSKIKFISTQISQRQGMLIIFSIRFL